MKKKTIIQVIILFVLSVFIPVVTYILTKAVELYTISLIPLSIAFYFIGKFTFKEINLNKLNIKKIWIALLWPLLLSSVLLLLAFITNNVTYTPNLSWFLVFLGIIVDGLITALLLIPTEEGIFRGLIQTYLGRIMKSKVAVILIQGVLFSLWHVPTLFLIPDIQGLSIAGIFIYLSTAVVAGITIGIIRDKTESLYLACYAHSVWNQIVYILFGYGMTAGMFTFKNMDVWHPESGVIGLALNFIVMVVFISTYFKIEIKKEETSS